MNKPTNKRRAPEMNAEYDFSGGVRGKYVNRYREGTNLVLLDPELAAAFPASKSVNDALRALVTIATRAEPASARNLFTRPQTRFRTTPV